MAAAQSGPRCEHGNQDPENCYRRQEAEYGHSTPLVLDENYNLLGFVHLIDLLMSVRHVWENSTQSVASDKSDTTLKDLAISFVGSIDPDDSILKALDVMMSHRVSLVPVMKEGKLQGILKLSGHIQQGGRLAI